MPLKTLNFAFILTVLLLLPARLVIIGGLLGVLAFTDRIIKFCLNFSETIKAKKVGAFEVYKRNIAFIQVNYFHESIHKSRKIKRCTTGYISK